MNLVMRELDCAKPVADDTALEQFQRQWSTYQKLVESDALSHNAAGKVLHGILASEFAEPFSFLDIACGDAYPMVRTLAGTRVTRYRGIDLSEPALALAAANLANAPFDVVLDRGDFTQALRTPEPTDVAWCGLSVHHLLRDDKVRFLSAVRASTRTCFIIYEPTLLDGETRAGYMERFVRFNEAAMTLLSREEFAQIAHHVTTFDHPESSASWCSIGIEAGFAKATELFADPTGFHRVYRFDC